MHHDHIEERHNFYCNQYGRPVRLLAHHFWKSGNSEIIGGYIAVYIVASIWWENLHPILRLQSVTSVCPVGCSNGVKLHGKFSTQLQVHHNIKKINVCGNFHIFTSITTGYHDLAKVKLPYTTVELMTDKRKRKLRLGTYNFVVGQVNNGCYPAIISICLHPTCVKSSHQRDHQQTSVL